MESYRYEYKIRKRVYGDGREEYEVRRRASNYFLTVCIIAIIPAFNILALLCWICEGCPNGFKTIKIYLDKEEACALVKGSIIRDNNGIESTKEYWRLWEIEREKKRLKKKIVKTEIIRSCE